ncbi:unnamed protein product [Vicia faba]|uniref:FACT complex subunit SSRP1 n=1 Tax=Vicia faba TaxID=3906 RepID=A0AAV0YUK9_VICFA|nr:unnamed protein product [Vicia faba]
MYNWGFTTNALTEKQEQVLAGENEDSDREEVPTVGIENEKEFLHSVYALGKPSHEHLEAMAEKEQDDQYEDDLLNVMDPLNQINLVNYLEDLYCLAVINQVFQFRSCEGGYAVKSSLKAEDGIMYPLEKSSFFLPKPPTLILHEEIDYGEFERHAAGGSNMHYFDLLIRLKSEQ